MDSSQNPLLRDTVSENTLPATPTDLPTDAEPTDPEPTDPEPGVAGDFNGDDEVTTADIDLLFEAVGENSADTQFDLNEDGTVSTEDVDFLIGDLLRTLRGDTNLDGAVDFADFLVLSENFGKTVDGYANGDFDSDGMANFTDFLFLSGNFGKQPEVEEPTDPEPTDPKPTDPEPTPSPSMTA